MTAFLLAVLVGLGVLWWVASASIEAAEKRGYDAGANAERDAVVAWLDGSARGMLARGNRSDANMLLALEGMMRANAHRDFREQIRRLDAQYGPGGAE
jgi:hypothetical protein